MSAKVYFRSFAGGEIGSELLGRVDLTKFQTGLTLCKNFEVLPHGPVRSRAGLERISEAKYRNKVSVLIPFIYSNDEAVAIEAGDQYMRFHTNGGTLLNTSQALTAATQANPVVVTYSGVDNYSNGQTVFITGVAGMTQLNGRFFKVANVNTGANTFELQDLGGTNINGSSYTAYSSGGTVASVYEISTPYLEADLYDLHYKQNGDALTIVHPSYQQRKLTRASALSWTLATFTLVPTISAPAAPTVVVVGAGGTTYKYVTTAVQEGTLEESLASAETSVTNDLTAGGNVNRITTATVSGAVRYNIYKAMTTTGNVFGYIGQSDGSMFQDANITPDLTKTPAIANDPFVGASNYPTATGDYKGRAWFGGTTNKRQNLWATRSATDANMSYSVPTRDDDAIAVRLTSRRATTIRHIVPLDDLLVLTSSGAWKVGADNSDVLTPTTINPRVQGDIGASMVQPVVTNESVLYPQARGGRLRELRYDAVETQRWRSTDISLMAPHLFDGYTLKQVTFQAAPSPVVWAVRSDGLLLGLTYLPEHQVAAWHRHDTEGTFESVCTLPEGNEDILYVIVQRELQGATVRSIERKRSRFFAAQEDAFCVDCGLTYDGAATGTITGLWHLEGETVKVLADGGVHPDVTVTNGSITLEQNASVVHVGLGYDCDGQTLPPVIEAAAFGQSLMKNANRAHVRVYDTLGLRIGPAFDKLREVKWRTDEAYGLPPEWRTGTVNVAITPAWASDAPLCFRQSEPLPATVLAIAWEGAVGG